MSADRVQADDVAMKGGYSLATKGAKDCIDGATPLVLGAIDAIDGARGLGRSEDPFTISDMGTADAGTSLDMIRAALARVRERAPARPISLVYSDQPRNDFNALLRTVHRPDLASDGSRSMVAEIPSLFVFASATSFYRQIVPDGTLDLGFSATAMHWLSRKPADISDHVQAVGARGREREAFAEQGHRDWSTILRHRARELAPGGRLVLVNFARDEQGRYLGNTGGANMFDTFNALWVSLKDDGVIDDAEYRAMTLPQYYNTVEEFTAPLADPAHDAHRAGLRLDHAETRVVGCPFAAEFRSHRDPARFARDYVPTLRSWTESTFFAGLSASRPVEQRREIIEQYYAQYEGLVRESPDGHGMDYVHCYMVIRKE